MPNPTIIMPDEMCDEIDRRRPSTVSRSEWIRDAIAARFDAEDADEWEKPSRETGDPAEIDA